MHVYADRSARHGVAGLSRLGGSRAGAHRRVVRDVPALGRARPDAQRDVPRGEPAGCRPSPTWVSTSCTCRRFIRSVEASGRGATTAWSHGRAIPGSPWAIGSAGRRPHGHRAGARDARRLRRVPRARPSGSAWRSRSISRGNARPIIPWVREHPDWFRHRPDGTIKYAENPPKKYQDIYPLDFECDDWRALWQALLDGHAVLGRPRRADLPRRQPPHQDVRVLGLAHRRGARAAIRASSSSSEAFTRPRVMQLPGQGRVHASRTPTSPGAIRRPS